METGKEDEVLPRTKPENKGQAISPWKGCQYRSSEKHKLKPQWDSSPPRRMVGTKQKQQTAIFKYPGNFKSCTGCGTSIKWSNHIGKLFDRFLQRRTLSVPTNPAVPLPSAYRMSTKRPAWKDKSQIGNHPSFHLQESRKANGHINSMTTQMEKIKGVNQWHT